MGRRTPVGPRRRARRSRCATRRQLYEFRLQHGFSDVADAAFERLWESPIDDVGRHPEICVETGAADRGPRKVPVDLLRQK